MSDNAKPEAYDSKDVVPTDALDDAASFLRNAERTTNPASSQAFAQIATAYALMDIADTLREIHRRGIRVEEAGGLFS